MPTLKLDGDATGAVRVTEDVNKAAKKLVPTFREVSEATDKARESHGQAFGVHAIQELGSYAAGLFTVHKGIEAVTEALEAQAEAKRKAAEHDKQALTGAGELANVSSSPEAFARNIAIADRIQRKGIVPDRNMAEHVAAGMAGAELNESQQQFLMRVGQQKRIAGGQLGEFAGSVKGFEEGFDLDSSQFERISKEFIAGASDTLGKVSPMDMARQIGDLADKAKENGLNPDQTIAMYTAIQRQAKTPKSASARLKEVFEGGGDLNKSESARYAIELQRVQQAGTTNLPDFIAGNPRLNAARTSEEAGAEFQTNEDSMLALRENLYGSYVTQQRGFHRQQYGYGFRGAVQDKLDRFRQGLNEGTGMEDEILRRASSNDPGDRALQQSHGDPTADQLPAELLGQIRDYLKEQTEVMQSRTNDQVISGRQE